MKRLLLAILLSIGVNPTSSIAQSQDKCSQILSHGIWDTRASSNTSSYKKSFLNWFCSQEFSSEGEMNEAGISTNFPITFSGNFKSSDWKQYSSSACNSQSEFIDSMSSSNSFSSIANSEIINAWSSCIQKVGVSAYVETTSTPSVVLINVSYKNVTTDPDDAAEVFISSVEVSDDGEASPMECISPQFGKFSESGDISGIKIRGGQSTSFRCKRNVCKAALITIEANRVGAPEKPIELQRSPSCGYLPNCEMKNAAGECIRCQWNSLVLSGNNVNTRRVCANMPVNSTAKAVFIGTHTVTDRGVGGTCSFNEYIVDGNENLSQLNQHDNVTTCTTQANLETDFIEYKDNYSSVKLVSGQCKWESNTLATCRIEGKLTIFTLDGQP